MEPKKLLQMLSVMLVVALCATPAMAAYTANYTVSDIDDIVIDITGTAMVEVKGDIPDIVDLGVLALIISLLGTVLIGIVGLFVVVPKMMSRTKKKISV